MASVRSFEMMNRSLEALVALALALGARPIAAVEQVIRDDFVEDPDPFDGEPLQWGVGHPCCPAQVEEKPGEGIRITALSRNDGILVTALVFAGDVTMQTQVQVGSGAGLSFGDPFSESGYVAFLDADGSSGLLRLDNGLSRLWKASRVDFDPSTGDAILELRTIGPDVEFRAWPEGDARPVAALLTFIKDEEYRQGSVAVTAHPLIPICVRWAEITMTAPLEPGLQRPGDCNQDGKLDISDAVCLLGFLFLGRPEWLPCGDGSAASAANVSLADWQPDGRTDLSDGIGLLRFLFGGGGPHPLGNECTGIPECPEACER